MAIEKYKLNENSKIAHTIGVISGKGGVGKSFVTENLANELVKLGYKVGILDADITGPSIPMAYGIKEKLTSDGKAINPSISKNGVKIVSVNLLLDDPTQPVLWRAPVISSAISQFYQDVNWDELDYLLIDMPPGTGDVALTVFQSIELDGCIIVSSPQDLVAMIVKKAVNMAQMMNVKILGLVENMSYFTCPHCGEITEMYGKSSLDEEAAKHNIKNTLRLPIDPEFANKVDSGKVDEIEISDFSKFAEEISKF